MLKACSFMYPPSLSSALCHLCKHGRDVRVRLSYRLEPTQTFLVSFTFSEYVPVKSWRMAPNAAVKTEAPAVPKPGVTETVSRGIRAILIGPPGAGKGTQVSE